MSQPKRLSLKGFSFGNGEIIENTEWVPVSDYAALAAENERLKKEKHEMTFQINIDDALTAENERLRKAGDAMADTRNKPTTLSEFGHLAMAWFAAKEGVDAK